jgi:hypothetical protein
LPALLKDSTPSTLAPLDLTSTLTLDLARPQFLLDVLILSVRALMMVLMRSRPTTPAGASSPVPEANTKWRHAPLDSTSIRTLSPARLVCLQDVLIRVVLVLAEITLSNRTFTAKHTSLVRTTSTLSEHVPVELISTRTQTLASKIAHSLAKIPGAKDSLVTTVSLLTHNAELTLPVTMEFTQLKAVQLVNISTPAHDPAELTDHKDVQILVAMVCLATTRSPQTALAEATSTATKEHIPSTAASSAHISMKTQNHATQPSPLDAQMLDVLVYLETTKSQLIHHAEAISTVTMEFILLILVNLVNISTLILNHAVLLSQLVVQMLDALVFLETTKSQLIHHAEVISTVIMEFILSILVNSVNISTPIQNHAALLSQLVVQMPVALA